MRDRPQAYEQELAETVGTATDRWLTELRLAVVGIAVSVGLGAADVALGLGGWEVALAAGLVSTFVFVVLLWRLRPRAEARRPASGELSHVEDELARIRAALEQEGDPPARAPRPPRGRGRCARGVHGADLGGKLHRDRFHRHDSAPVGLRRPTPRAQRRDPLPPRKDLSHPARRL